MKVVFATNFFNHHQQPLSEAMASQDDMEYCFVQTVRMDQERLNMGWEMHQCPDYVLPVPENSTQWAETQAVIDDADVVILGSAPDELLRNRHQKQQLCFRYSERFYRRGFPKWQYPLRWLKNYWRFGRHKNEYMLCASAYTAQDLAKTHTFIGKTYQWGYFPETYSYDIDHLMAQKQNNAQIRLLWAGRLIHWKHPEMAIILAEQLKQQGYAFVLSIIGNGEMENQLQNMIREKHLEDCVEMLGAMRPEVVRGHMEQADVFLFTSDFNEGWGAVLNESMNSGCAVVASHAIGSVPFLVHHGENGLVFKSENMQSLYTAVKKLMDSAKLRESMGRCAYQTIAQLWNADVAAQRFIKLVEEIQDHGKCDLFADGPCSRAKIIKNEWFADD